MTVFHVRWTCPRCGQTVASRLPHAQAETCKHLGTIHEGKPATPMTIDQPTPVA